MFVSLYFTAFEVLALHQSYYVEELAIQPSYSLPRISHSESRKCIHINLAVYLSQLPYPHQCKDSHYIFHLHCLLKSCTVMSTKTKLFHQIFQEESLWLHHRSILCSNVNYCTQAQILSQKVRLCINRYISFFFFFF